MDAAAIISDLSTERPGWILSCYGPGKNAAGQLFGGYPQEQSFEEMRFLHFELAARGRMDDALRQAQALNEHALEQINAALQDPKGAVSHIIAASSQHPNRIDLCKQPGLVLQSGQEPQPGLLESSVSGGRPDAGRLPNGTLKLAGKPAFTVPPPPGNGPGIGSFGNNPFAKTHAAQSVKVSTM